MPLIVAAMIIILLVIFIVFLILRTEIERYHHSTTGAIFSDVYMMVKAPLQYNTMKIVDTDKKYLCGKAICLED